MASIPAQTSAPRKWYEIWWAILRHPGKETFQSILQESNANATRGFIWIAVVTLITSLVIGLASLPLIRTLPRNSSNLFVNSSIFIVILVLEVILAPFFAIAGMAIGAAIYHGIARLFGGVGQWGQLVFCLAAISAPFALLSAALNLIAAPFTMWFPSDLWLVSILLRWTLCPGAGDLCLGTASHCHRCGREHWHVEIRRHDFHPCDYRGCPDHLLLAHDPGTPGFILSA